ncbi:MAG: carboxylate-amine ligase [Azospirillum sp.]|nr:carboxylate-amine ligase [Azospirillum sp.]MCA3267252.1 carboxylate-amine ligase [Azospirillum sp.]
MTGPAFTIGLEEEYLLVDRATRDLARDPPADLVAQTEAELAKRGMPGQVSPEFLRAQIEVQTRVCASVADARAQLATLRRTVAEVAARHGLAPIAASTHPFAEWRGVGATDRERYRALERDLQGVGRRLVICGLHVHVGIEDEELRVDLMNQAGYFLPHLLALSTSSPFWRGEDTGLASYRIAIFNELPRTGLPDHFESWGEYRRQVDRLVKAGLIDDASKLWWDIRPSARFPTLEMRATDMCTALDHAISIAALYRSLISMLWRLKTSNQRWRIYPHMLVKENRWRAQRYGIDEGLVDFGKGEIVPVAGLVDELIELVRPDAERLGCVAEVEGARAILRDGTSAHRQRRAFAAATAAGHAKQRALEAVVDDLIAGTVAGL